MDRLPDEVLAGIASFLPSVKDHAAMSRTCRQFKDIFGLKVDGLHVHARNSVDLCQTADCLAAAKKRRCMICQEKFMGKFLFAGVYGHQKCFEDAGHIGRCYEIKPSTPYELKDLPIKRLGVDVYNHGFYELLWLHGFIEQEYCFDTYRTTSVANDQRVAQMRMRNEARERAVAEARCQARARAREARRLEAEAWHQAQAAKAKRAKHESCAGCHTNQPAVLCAFHMCFTCCATKIGDCERHNKVQAI